MIVTFTARTTTERPILFSTPMAGAIAAGEKTMTRRVVKFTNEMLRLDFELPSDRDSAALSCPYGVPGSRVWCREPWRTHVNYDHLPGSELRESAPIHYEADGEKVDWPHYQPGMMGRYRYARFMPRRFARSIVEITEVRVEPLQAITGDDVLREGFSQQVVESLICRRADRFRLFPEYWIAGAGDGGLSYCLDCCQKEVARLKLKEPAEEFWVNGGFGDEGDSRSYCQTCNRPLDNTYTTCACEQECDHFEEHGINFLIPENCDSWMHVLGSAGFEFYDGCRQDEAAELKAMYEAIQRISFQGAWDLLNGKRGFAWKANPWVFVISFRRLTP